MDCAVGNRGHEIRRGSGRGRTGARMCGRQRSLSGERTGVGERYEKDKRKKTNKWEMWNFHEVEFCVST